MTNKNFKLGIVGTLEKTAIDKYRNVLEIHDNSEKEIILFCNYSSFEIPTGYIFSDIENEVGDRLSSANILLEKVTQQFLMPYDLIPVGHKTICKFKFLNTEIPELVKSLPSIHDWYQSNECLFFT